VLKNRYICLIETLEKQTMKILKVIPLLFALIILNACSSDSGDSGGGGSTADSFTYKVEGVDVPVPTITAIRHENIIEILGQNADGRSMFLTFNKFGQLIRATSTSTTTDPFNWKNSAYDFSLNTFDFELVSLDETNKTVSVTYSGKLYDDEYDLANSTFTNVSGTANVHYTETAPAVTGLGVTAKIAGNDWRAVKVGLTNNGAIENVVVDENSDDAYKIGFYMDQINTAAGTFTFTGASANNKVILSKYDSVTNEYVDYTCSGTFQLTLKDTDGFGNTIISGTFSFTAVPPTGPTIQVTNGVFKEYYNW
jgi:hypothetical protein